MGGSSTAAAGDEEEDEVKVRKLTHTTICLSHRVCVCVCAETCEGATNMAIGGP